MMPSKRYRKRQKAPESLRPRVIFNGKCVQVWLVGKGELAKLKGSLDIALALDASRHGQDLVAELLDVAMQHAERNRGMT